MVKKRKIDKYLHQALIQAYIARAKLFHNGVVTEDVDSLIKEIDLIPHSEITWDLGKMGITQSAFQKVRNAGGIPHQVFAHPKIISNRPHLVSYYRNMSTISQKGIGQILFSTARYESKRSKKMKLEDAKELCVTLNRIMSGVIDGISNYSVPMTRKAILSEIGSQLQGSWANLIGKGATRNVERIIQDYIEINKLGHHAGGKKYILDNGWTIIFSPEPDVAFFDPKGKKQIAIEIKGSLDVAGAQTRYGEAKKSFAKQIAENTRCYTIYLASCFTDAVVDQIKKDGQVRDWFNLTSILSDKEERSLFLQKLFHIINTPTR